MSLSATLCPSPFEMVSLTESALARLTPWISRDTVSRWQAHTTSHGFLRGCWGSEVRPSGCYWVFIQQALYCLSRVPVPVGNGFLKYYIFIYLFCVHVSVCTWKYCAVAGMWRKEDNLRVGSLILQCEFWGSNSLPGLVASAFTCWAIFAGPGGDLRLWFFKVIEPGASCMLSNCSTTELHLQLSF